MLADQGQNRPGGFKHQVVVNIDGIESVALDFLRHPDIVPQRIAALHAYSELDRHYSSDALKRLQSLRRPDITDGPQPASYGRDFDRISFVRAEPLAPGW